MAGTLASGSRMHPRSETVQEAVAAGPGPAHPGAERPPRSGLRAAPTVGHALRPSTSSMTRRQRAARRGRASPLPARRSKRRGRSGTRSTAWVPRLPVARRPAPAWIRWSPAPPVRRALARAGRRAAGRPTRLGACGRAGWRRCTAGPWAAPGGCWPARAPGLRGGDQAASAQVLAGGRLRCGATRPPAPGTGAVRGGAAGAAPAQGHLQAPRRGHPGPPPGPAPVRPAASGGSLRRGMGPSVHLEVGPCSPQLPGALPTPHPARREAVVRAHVPRHRPRRSAVRPPRAECAKRQHPT